MSVRHLVHLKHRNKFKLPKTAVKFYLEIPSEKTRRGGQESTLKTIDTALNEFHLTDLFSFVLAK